MNLKKIVPIALSLAVSFVASVHAVDGKESERRVTYGDRFYECFDRNRPPKGTLSSCLECVFENSIPQEYDSATQACAVEHSDSTDEYECMKRALDKIDQATRVLQERFDEAVRHCERYNPDPTQYGFCYQSADNEYRDNLLRIQNTFRDELKSCQKPR
jgi:hypothetical protein